MRNRNYLGQIPGGVAPKVIAEDFYIYNIDFASLAASATGTGFIQIEADSDFLIQKLAYFVDLAGAVQTFNSLVVPLVTVTIIDTGSGRQLMSNAIAIPSIFGDGRLPFILPTPKLFSKNTRINVNVANFSAATTYTNLRLNFIGKKIFTSG